MSMAIPAAPGSRRLLCDKRCFRLFRRQAACFAASHGHLRDMVIYISHRHQCTHKYQCHIITSALYVRSSNHYSGIYVTTSNNSIVTSQHRYPCHIVPTSTTSRRHVVNYITSQHRPYGTSVYRYMCYIATSLSRSLGNVVTSLAISHRHTVTSLSKSHRYNVT